VANFWCHPVDPGADVGIGTAAVRIGDFWYKFSYSRVEYSHSH